VKRKYYREPAGESFPRLEEEILQAWTEQDILQRVKDRMRGGIPLIFCEGPPTANARPHIGHALTRVVKDSFLRYYIMSGRQIVPYIAGWDCHGLPVEIEVEKALGLKGKKAIEELGVKRFNELCRESVVRYEKDWEQMSRRIGYWIDYGNAYFTMSRDYVESVWWSVKQLHSKGELAKEHRVVPYCYRCGTTLGTHEVALGFRETEDRFVVAKFRLRQHEASLLVWTASPWTLVGNALLAVNRDEKYILFEHAGERLIVGEASKGFLAPSDKVVQTMQGSDLLGMEYESPLKYHDFRGKAFKIVHSKDAFADTEGTGILNVSPAYGAVDFEIAKSAGLSVFDPVGSDGRFSGIAPELEGRLARDSNPEIIRILESKGALFKWGVLKHAYPHCWRCETPLIYKALDTWFVKTFDSRKRIVELNEQIAWIPEAFKQDRFGNFLAEAKDWAISRTRYWGTPLPIWRCGRGHELCVGSYEELRSHARGKVPADIDPHRPSVDEIVLNCPECGGSMTREDCVIDCWYDSGCAPFAQYHYPFENIAEFDTHQSVDFIAEGVDQTRGWFYTQLAIGALLFGKPAYKSVLVLGHVLDEKGKKITRGKENVVYPDEVFSNVGADATRLFFLSNPVWQPVVFSMESVRETMVGTLNTLLNLYAFFASNANAYGFQPQGEYARTHDLDRWIISRLHSTIQEARSGFEGFEVHRSVRACVALVGDISSWYVRRSRRRFWEENDPQDRYSAHCTLHECLLTLAKLMAPLIPFFSDWLYRNLKGQMQSVHMEDYPEFRKELVNASLEAQMSLVITAVEAGRMARQKANVKLRQPLPSVVVAADKDRAWILRRYERMLSDELNVKRVEVVESRDMMVHYAVAPNLKILGPKLKESAGEVSKLLSKMDQNALAIHLSAKGKIRIGGFDLRAEDVLIYEKEKPGYSHAEVGDIHVYAELEMSQNLLLEGLSREIIRRVQHMRKELRLEFEDPVIVEFSGHPDVEIAFSAHRSHIMHEVHAIRLERNPGLAGGRKWIINKLPVELVVRKA